MDTCVVKNIYDYYLHLLSFRMYCLNAKRNTWTILPNKNHKINNSKQIYANSGDKFNTLNINSVRILCSVLNGGVFLGNSAKSLMDSFDLPLKAIALISTGIWHDNFQRGLFPPTIFSCLSRSNKFLYFLV